MWHSAYWPDSTKHPQCSARVKSRRSRNTHRTDRGLKLIDGEWYCHIPSHRGQATKRRKMIKRQSNPDLAYSNL